MLIPAAVGLLFGVGIVQVARALLRRERWAYYVAIILSVLGSVAILFGIAQAGAIGQPPANSRVFEQIAVVARVALFIAAIFQIASFLLVILSYRDFFGPMVRFQPAVEPAEHHQHYNNGVAYKDRGMWFMAAQEWEAAVIKKPREPNYLHALGLAYAQLKQYDRARTTLDRALQTAPDNQQIKESRALVDQMAAKT
jgi:tetratricopeptide (TPR) repeat protein